MQLDHLKYFKAMVEYGSMSKAAEKMYVSQQYISKAIGAMEKEIGQKVFVRGKRRTELTIAGEKLYRFAERYETARGELTDVMAEKYLRNIKGNIRIGAMNTAQSMVLPQILCRYYHDYPDIKLEIVTGDARELQEMLWEGKVDMAIVLSAKIKGEMYLAEKEEIECRLLAKGRTCYWVSIHSPLAEREEITMAEAVQYPLVIQTRIDSEMLEEIYARFGHGARIVAESDNLYLLQKLVADDVGICPDASFHGEEWINRYAFEGKGNVKAIPVREEEVYESNLYLLTDRRRVPTVLENHVVRYILKGKWKEV